MRVHTDGWMTGALLLLAAGPAFAASPAASFALPLALAGLGALVPTLLYLDQRRRVKRLRRLLQGEVSIALPRGGLRGFAEDVVRLRDTLSESARQLDVAIAQRDRAETAQRESEERYTLAVRGANDGLWEWNVKTDTLFASPRWLAMLGLDQVGPPGGIAGWKSRIHPDDLLQVEAALRDHLDGFSPRFQSEHRVLHRDGGHRWILSRGSAIRHASGTAYRMIGLDTDITPFKRMEEIMLRVAEGTSSDTGQAFFRSLVKNFAAVLGVSVAFVTECLDFPTTRVRALAYFDRGHFRDDVEYDLSGTPCERVIRENVACLYETGLGSLFPREAELGLDSYYGLPICDPAGKVIGHLAFLHEKQLDEGVVLESIFRIFTARAAAELRRQHMQRAVAELATGLSDTKPGEALRTLVKSFASVMGVREAFVTECSEGGDLQLHVLAWWCDGGFREELEYPLAGSVCEETVREGKLCIYPQGIGARFPQVLALDREAYVGVPCRDSSGRVVGHIACFHDRALRGELPEEAVLRLFAERASVMLERRRLASRTRLEGIGV